MGGKACSSNLIIKTFPFNDAAFSAAAAATAILFDEAHEQALVARLAQAIAQARVHAVAALRTPEPPPLEQRIAQAAFPRTQQAPTIRPEVNI